jgi:hypothetical protein
MNGAQIGDQRYVKGQEDTCMHFRGPFAPS